MHAETRSLTGLRGLAACWVMLGHYFSRFAAPGLPHTLISHMYLAVDLFMILSGFVLGLTYEARFTPVNLANSLGFLRNRIARLFPLYILVTLACLVMMRLGLGDNSSTRTPLAIAANLAMVQSWWWPDDSISGTGWSLSIEWGVNLVFPLLVILLLRPSAWRAGLVAAIALAGLAWAALTLGQGASAEPLNGAINWYYVPLSWVRCGSEFILGLLCWRLRRRGLCAWAGGSLALIAMLASMGVCVADGRLDVVFVLLACLLILGFSFEASPVSAIFATAVPVWLGAISFSIYLLHLAILPPRAALFAWARGAPIGDSYELENIGQGVVCVAVVLLLSSASYYYFEKPMQRWTRRMLTR